MPTKAPTARLTRPIKSRYTASEFEEIKAEARLRGMTDAKYQKALVMKARNAAPMPASKRRGRGTDALVHELHQVGLQLKRIGVNFNQLTKQGNQALVPITRREAEYFMHHFQLALARVTSTVEKVDP